MNNLKAKLTKMNPKKGFCNLILCFIIFCIVAGVGTIAKFGSRIPEIRQQIQTIENAHEEQVDNFWNLLVIHNSICCIKSMGGGSKCMDIRCAYISNESVWRGVLMDIH